MNVKMPIWVKWPNDILAEKDKLAGILIENALRGNYINQSVIGVGVNVNQKEFPDNIGNITSLANIVGTDFNKDQLLQSIIMNMQYFVNFIHNEEFSKLKELYIASLYKYNIPAMFEDFEGITFLGKIVDISESGRLVIELENETTRKFSLKEIKFASRLK